MHRYTALIFLILLWAASSVSANDQQFVRLLSYNIRYDNPNDTPSWSERRPHLAEQLAFLEPDIFGVQEAELPMVDYLASKLPGYDHYGVGRDDGQRKGESTAIFFRKDRFELIRRETKWCSPTPDTPSKTLDAALPRTFTRMVLRDRRSARILDLRNVHLDHKGPRSRLACVQQMEGLPPYDGAYVLIFGDFNFDIGAAPYKELTDGQGLHLNDARFAAERKFGPYGTYNAFDIARADKALDHIFVDNRLSVSNFAVVAGSIDGQVISDHFPVYVKVGYPKP